MKQNANSVCIGGSGVKAVLLNSGDIKKITCGKIMINQFIGNNLEPMASNIFVRIYNAADYSVYPMLGSAANAAFSVNDNQIIYSGALNGTKISYRVYLTIVDNMWFYDAFIENSDDECVIDLVYAQDIGIAAEGHILSNEAYNAQYITHSVFETECGYAVCSRQNQQQESAFPFLQLGSFSKITSYSTDGTPFFGAGYKFDNKITELYQSGLNNRLYQYELAYVSLKTQSINLKDTAHATFYGAFLPNYKSAVAKPIELLQIKKAYSKTCFPPPVKFNTFKRAIDVNKTLCSLPLSSEELAKRYLCMKHKELNGDKLLSFFTDTGGHVVLMDKERLTERPHGHIILSGKTDFAKEDTLASTSYIYGVFASQVVLGNTSFNKLSTNCRDAHNISKTSGQRLMIKLGGEYKLLTMPAVFEMGLNYCKWVYKLPQDIIEIVSYTETDRPALNFEVKSASGHKYDFLAFSRLCTSQEENPAPPEITRRGNSLTIKHNKDTMCAKVYPKLYFEVTVNADFKLHDDSLFYPEHGCLNEQLMAVEINGASSFSIETLGVNGEKAAAPHRGFAKEAESYRQWFNSGLNGFSISLSGSDEKLNSQVERLCDIVPWFSHNARIHYASPHGLEQYGGAAWGTRDVCQGAFEYFMAVQRYDTAFDIIKRVYEHQYAEDGSWPQWFMFDKYHQVQQSESHGDIIIWPLKAVANYLLATENYELLNCETVYTSKNGFAFTEQKQSIFLHILKQIEYIKAHFIKGTCLSSYGDGDWDDTLQPANPELRKSMVSGWTVSLTYQTLQELAVAVTAVKPNFADELNELALKIQQDYNKYIIKDGVAAGFIVFESGQIKYLLHPQDKETGLHYRLLPMTRSVIGGMFTKQQAEAHTALIKKHLYFPDGVRLMDNTCAFKGGVSEYFKRAETAANFGREIGLQYLHAHIRFIEAMAKMGDAREVWLGLAKVNPILLDTVVKNASKRQSNCYFSSSDGAFDNRYEAMKGFDKLRSAEVNVKGGWRIYSSGSGIFINQLISSFLGLRIRGGKIILDPAVPKELNGLVFTYKIGEYPVTIKYNLSGKKDITKLTVNGKNVSFEYENQPYRKGGAIFGKALITQGSVIELYM